ncbi:ABC transporter permease [bacterium]|nr:ABC transporter permease [bacterium]
MLQYYVGSALAQALRYRLQTLLIILAVGIGIANIIVLISMTDLGRRQTMSLINDFGARVIIVTPYIDLSGGPFAMFSPANTNGYLPSGLYEALKGSPAVDKGPQGGVAAMLILPGNAGLLPAGWQPAASAEGAARSAPEETAAADEASEAAPDSAADSAADSAEQTAEEPAEEDTVPAEPEIPVERSHFTTLAGVTPEFVNVGGTHVVAGRFITAEEQASGAKVVCLGSTPLKSLFGPRRGATADGSDVSAVDPAGEAADNSASDPAAADSGSEGADSPAAAGAEEAVEGEEYDEPEALDYSQIQVDPKLAVGRQILIKGEPFTIVGVMVERGRIGFEDVDDRVFMPLSTLQQLFEYDGIQGMIVRYREGLKEQEAMEQLRASMAASLAEGESLDETVSTFTVKQATQLMDATLSIFRAVLWGIGSIALLVAGIGIMNVMLIRVLQRRAEIGLRRAVGATRRSVVLQFVTESTVQAMMGAVLGVVLGVIGVALFCRYSDWDFYIAPLTILLAISFAALVGVGFGVYPAWRAARVDPIQSLRSEM